MNVTREVYDDREFSHKETWVVSTLKQDRRIRLATSPFYRNNTIRRIKKELPKISPEDTNKLNEIRDLVVSLDLDDPRRGRVLPQEYLDMLNQKLEENKNMRLDEENEM